LNIGFLYDDGSEIHPQEVEQGASFLSRLDEMEHRPSFTVLSDPTRTISEYEKSLTINASKKKRRLNDGRG